jgi:hypothetical protein
MTSLFPPFNRQTSFRKRPFFYEHGRGVFTRQTGIAIPTLSINFLNTTTLSSAVTFSRPSLGMLFDSTGKYTWCPNNLLLYSNTFNDASWVLSNVSTPTSGQADPFGGTNAWLLSPSGANPKIHQAITTPASGGKGLMAIWLRSATGSSFSLVIGSDGAGVDPNPTTTTITVTTTWQQFSLPVSWVSTSAANFSIGDGSTGWANGNNLHAYAATYSAVTYETAARSVDQVITTSAVYYGPRFDYNPTTLASLGILIEPSRTNVALWNRDLTNGAWVKTGCSAAKNQTGIDGAASSASSLTATAPNATCLQTVALASSLRITSAYVRAIAVTGDIQITTDNITWTTVTVGSTWSRVAIPNQTVTNPVFGFRLVNSGDSIAVDFVVNESGLGTNPSASTAMWTTSSSVTRSQDDMSITPISAFYDQAHGTFFTSFDTLNTATDTTVYCVDDGTTGQANEFDVRSLSATSIAYRTRTASTNSFSATHSGFTVGQIIKSAFAVKVDNMAASTNTVPVTQSTPPNAMPATAMTQIIFGRRGTTGVLFIGHVRGFNYYNTRLTNVQMQVLTS